MNSHPELNSSIKFEVVDSMFKDIPEWKAIEFKVKKKFWRDRVKEGNDLVEVSISS